MQTEHLAKEGELSVLLREIRMPTETEKLLVAALKGTYEGLDVRLCEIPYKWEKKGLTVSGNFFYISFQRGLPTVDAFVTYVYNRIVPFCIPRNERREKESKFIETGDYRYINDLLEKAKNLFIRKEGVIKTVGEPGELILFILLEAILRAPQIVCKMYLKTSEHMPVHGTDAIHARLGSKPDRLCLVWGESKVYEELSSALDSICDSIKDFTKDLAGRSIRDRDIDIMLDHMDIEEESLRNMIIKYFDPYSEESGFLEESIACFVGYEDKWYKDLDNIPVAETESRFSSHYKRRISSACELFEEKIRKNGLSKIKVHFFLLPFPEVEAFRRKFVTKLGILR